MHRGTFAIVDNTAIYDNVQTVRRSLPSDVRLMAVIKANGYGHGAAEVAAAALAAGATDLGVATLEEAIQLRESGFDTPILILGAMSPAGTQVAAQYGVQATLSENWVSRDVPTFDPPVSIHLKVDTGMSRLGLSDQTEIVEVGQWLRDRKDIEWVGTFTHLAYADAPTRTHSAGQIAEFGQILQKLTDAGLHPGTVHAANTAALMRSDADWKFNLVRLGIGMYGYPPDRDFPLPYPLYPALHLYAFVTRVDTIPKGRTVGYGATFVAERETVVATVPVGYADGYPRYLSNQGSVLIRGHLAPVIGNVCMDQLMLDVTDIPDVHTGDCVTLYGRAAPASWKAQTLESMSEAAQYEWLQSTFLQESKIAVQGADPEKFVSLDVLAKIGNTISYEIMCALSLRVPRIYCGEVGRSYDFHG